MRIRSAAAAFVLVAASVATPAAAHAQSTGPGSAQSRFPQPVRVGDLPGRALLEPIEAQTMLGRVRSIGRDRAGDLVAVIELSRWFGLRTRLIAIPVDAMVLLGSVVEPVAATPAQLWALPIVDAAAITPLPADATIRVGLARPSH